MMMAPYFCPLFLIIISSSNSGVGDVKGHQIVSVRSQGQVREIYSSIGFDVVDKDIRNVSNLVAQLSDYSRERLPERGVHTTGTGARGYFQVTHDITSLSHACAFQSVGKRIPILGRFSLGGPGRNKADSGPDSRGLAVRFFTDCGSWDLLSGSLVFFFKDVVTFSSDFLYTLRSSDFVRFWDIRASHPESVYRALTQASYLGTPRSFRHMDTSAGHTFKLVSSTGAETYARFHFISEQGARYNDISIARQLAEQNPKRAREDLRDSIARGDFPSWKLMIQTMPVDTANNVTFDPFDSTFLWPREDFPYQPVGRIVFTENPSNYTEEIEATAFNPGNLIPGIEPSKDRLFPYRVYAYDQLQRNRLGPNFRETFPINRPARDYKMLKIPFADMDLPVAGAGGSRNGECIFRQVESWYKAREEEEKKQIVQQAALVVAGVPAEVKEKLLTATYDKVDPKLGQRIRNAKVGAHVKGGAAY